MSGTRRSGEERSGVREKLGLAAAILGLLLSLALLWAIGRRAIAIYRGGETGAAAETAAPSAQTEQAGPAQSFEPSPVLLPELPEEPTPEPTPEPSPEPTPEPTPEPIHYSIPEDANAGPAPDEACYGVVSMDEPEKLLEVIQDARDRGLLGEDETVAFDPSVSFYRGIYSKDLAYYLDDTILVLLWKENMDGMCCTFTEIKIADPSQIRRKLAEDRFDAANQYYATELAR